MSATEYPSSREGGSRSGTSLLVVENVSVYYGDAQALSTICLSVNNNEIVAVLGSNGAGKTTLLKVIRSAPSS